MPENIAFKETASLNSSPVSLLATGLPGFDAENPFASVMYPFDPDDLEPLSPIFQSLVPTPYLNPFDSEENSLDCINNGDTTNNIAQALPPLSTVFSTRTAEIYSTTPLTSFTPNEQSDVVDVGHDFSPGLSFVNGTLGLPELNHLVFNDINSPLTDTHLYETEHNLSTLTPTPLVKARKVNKIPTRCTKVRGPRKKSTFPKELGKTPTVNSAFQKLRKLIPTEPVDRRLSKVETLRLAVSYIQHLGHSLETDSWVEQPCLLNRSTKTESGDVSTSICTFCMSKRKVL